MGSSQSGTLRRSGVVLGFAALALGLGGCGGAENSAPAGENVSAGRGATTEAPASAPLRDAKPAPADVLTAEGFGPLRIGMNLAEITKALGSDSEPNAVGGADPAQCDQFHPERAPKGMLVMVEQGRLTRISLIRDAAIKTDRGLGLGDSAAKVKAAYGPAAKASPHKYVDAPAAYVTAWAKGAPTGGTNAAPARGIRYEIDQTGKVNMIHAGGPSIEFVEGCS